jgi:hypothetical protein
MCAGMPLPHSLTELASGLPPLAYASERAPQSLPLRLCEADFSQPKQSQRLPRFAHNDRGEARNDTGFTIVFRGVIISRYEGTLSKCKNKSAK